MSFLSGIVRLPVDRGNYPYVTARVKGKKKNLLSSDTYPKLMKMEPSQIARLLGETTYREEMVALAPKYSGSELIEKALNMNLARNYRAILSFCKGDLKHMVEEYLDMWDVRNIKTVIRGVEHGIPPEEVLESVIPAGSFSEDFLRELAGQDRTEAVIDALARKGFAVPPADLMERFSKSRDLSEIEDFYDREYYVTLLDAIKGNSRPMKIYRMFIRKEIDVVNSKNLLKLKLEGMKPEKIMGYMIPGGSALTEERLKEISRMDTKEALDAIKEALRDDLRGVIPDAGAQRIALELDRYLMRTSEKLSRIYPLSVLPVIDFIIRKKKEVDFIRIIVKGKDNNLPESMIKELLVL